MDNSDYNVFKNKSYKTNVTGYLSIDVLEKLSYLAHVKNTSRNTLFEEAIVDYLDRNLKNKRF